MSEVALDLALASNQTLARRVQALTFENAKQRGMIKRVIKKLEQLGANSMLIQDLKDGIK